MLLADDAEVEDALEELDCDELLELELDEEELLDELEELELEVDVDEAEDALGVLKSSLTMEFPVAEYVRHTKWEHQQLYLCN